MSYFARLMSQGRLPIELCEHILSFSDDRVPVICSKETTTLGWFYYSVYSKRISDVINEEELDLCKKCKNWSFECVCNQTDKIIS